MCGGRGHAIIYQHRKLCDWYTPLSLSLSLSDNPISSPSSFLRLLLLLLLGRLVEELEHIRGGLKGVCRRPRTPAQRLNNIKRALSVLGDKKSMPVDHLWSEEAIREGDTSVIVPLLEQMRRAYGHHLKKMGGEGSL